MLVVKDKKQGIGTAVLTDLCKFADDKQIRIVLHVANKNNYIKTTSTERLKKFYRRFGFVSNAGRNRDWSMNYDMYRDPKSA